MAPVLAAAPMLERDDFSLNRHPTLLFGRMILSEKSATFRDHALASCLSMILSEKSATFRDYALGPHQSMEIVHRAIEVHVAHGDVMDVVAVWTTASQR